MGTKLQYRLYYDIIFPFHQSFNHGNKMAVQTVLWHNFPFPPNTIYRMYLPLSIPLITFLNTAVGPTSGLCTVTMFISTDASPTAHHFLLSPPSQMASCTICDAGRGWSLVWQWRNMHFRATFTEIVAEVGGWVGGYTGRVYFPVFFFKFPATLLFSASPSPQVSECNRSDWFYILLEF